MTKLNINHLAKNTLLGAIMASFLMPYGVVAAGNCQADYNKSGTVDLTDFATFAANYKKSGIDCSLDIVGGN